MLAGVIIVIRLILFYVNNPLNKFGEVIKQNAQAPLDKIDIVSFIREKYDLNVKPEAEKKVKID